MPNAERYARMTLEQRERKWDRQRNRRLSQPAVNGRLKQVLGEQDYLVLYDHLFLLQNGRCGICRKEPTKHRFHMDHDHKTLEIRGLLCYSCNTKLAFYEKFKARILRYLRGGHLDCS